MSREINSTTQGLRYHYDIDISTLVNITDGCSFTGFCSAVSFNVSHTPWKKSLCNYMTIWYVWSLYKRAKQSRQCQPHTRFCYCFRQVPCIYFSIAISFILSYWIDWYKMFCMGDELYRLIRIKLMDIFSISLNLEYPRNFFKESLWFYTPPPPPVSMFVNMKNAYRRMAVCRNMDFMVFSKAVAASEIDRWAS